MPDNIEMLLTFAILAVTILLFVFSRLRADIVAVLSLLALVLTGVLTSQQSLVGFAGSTTVIVAALFIVGEGLARTGITARLGQFLMQQAGNSELRLLIVLMIGTAALSAFMSNTATTVLVAPIVLTAALTLGVEPEAMMMMVAAGAAAAFLTPIASPTNTLIFEAGGYSWGDYAKVGLPLLFLVMAVSLLVAPLVWPL